MPILLSVAYARRIFPPFPDKGYNNPTLLAGKRKWFVIELAIILRALKLSICVIRLVIGFFIDI
jgi:hypothetical protein